MVQSNIYYKSRAVGVTSEVGLTTDGDLAELYVLKKHDAFGTSTIPGVRWYEPLYYTHIHTHTHVYTYIYIYI